MNKELLTIAEFARLAGISRQAVYKKLDNQLSKYVVNVNGQKMLDKSVLDTLNTKKIEDAVYQKNCKSVNQENDNNVNTVKQDVNKCKQVEIEWLRAELEKKDKRLERLETKLDEKDAEIMKLHDALIEALDKAHQLTDQQQQLQQLLQSRLLELPTVEAAESKPEQEPEPEQPVKRQGFFSKFFG